MDAALLTRGADQADDCGTSGRCRSVCSSCNVRLFAVCSALADDDIRSIEGIAKQVQAVQRQTVIQMGDKANALFTVTSGFLRLQQDLADGRRQVLGFAMPGDFLGLSLPERNSFSADALTSAALCRFERSDFLALSRQKPQLLERFHQLTANELSFAQDHMMLLGRRRAEERVALFLLRWRKRLAKAYRTSVTVMLPMGRQDIADHLGLTIETVSRIFARWSREKIILDVPGGVRILNEAALAEHAA